MDVSAPRGHWTKGKRRSSLSPAVWSALRQRIVDLLDEAPLPEVRSMRALATLLGVTDRTVRRWLAGEDLPPPNAMARLRAWHAEQRKRLDARKRS
ncbi:MAG: helix-turn-helix domain-containing protein [Isosphaeraceae bacterium]|nr:helix-turn-helix domain-containing protein [Isosphaeraceae bacterium]